MPQFVEVIFYFLSFLYLKTCARVSLLLTRFVYVRVGGGARPSQRADASFLNLINLELEGGIMS